MLIKELETFLEEIGEPVCKKIKIVDNAMKCSELALQHKEIFLLKWILENSNQAHEEYWNYLNTWLKSDQFKKLDKNDINREEFITIVELIENELLQIDGVDIFTMRTILDSVLLLINSNVFQHYFNYHMDIYFKLISSMLQKIECVEFLKEFLKMDIFHIYMHGDEKNYKNVLSILLPRLCESLVKFDCAEVFEQVSKIIQKCLFHKNHNSFKIYINNYFEHDKIEKQHVPKHVFKYILHTYQTQDAIVTYRVLFHAFCVAYESDFELIYKFFTLLVHIIGFNLKDKLILHKTKLDLHKSNLSLVKSQEILLALLKVLSEIKIDSKTTINNVTFTDFIRNILQQLLHLGRPSETCYKIFLKAITIDPLLIEPIIENLIIYTMILGSNNEQYENMIICMFDVFSKLRRVENLISKIVHTLNYHFNGHMTSIEEIYGFNGEIDTGEIVEEENVQADSILTENILQHFRKCICNLASWQIINIFKTLLYQLRLVVDDVDKNDNTVNFMEILSVLLCTLLCSVRIAEHTVVANVVEKSLKQLEELRNILEKFGKVLLHREHNEQLMRSFLNIAYNWAELYITLEYYLINCEAYLKKVTDYDSKSCNITYLHSYLSVKQWCLISERITNFGEPNCKQLLEKLYVQKLRGMLLFEKSVNEDIVQNIIKSVSSNVDVMWTDMLEDKFVVNNLLPKMDSSVVTFLAEKLVTNFDKLGSIHEKSHITDSPILITAVTYVIITRINKLATRKKHKLNEDIFTKATSIRITSVLTEDSFFSDNTKEIVDTVKDLYNSNQNDENVLCNINEEKVCRLLQISERFPVIFCTENVQKLYLMYVCALHRDFSVEFRKGRHKQLQADCEKLITGILQHCKFKLVDLFKITNLCKDVVETYDKWEHIFTLITENTFRDEQSLELYKPVVSHFTENLLTPAYIRCCIVIINITNRIKKVKSAKNIKNTIEKYKAQICDKILNVALENEPTIVLLEGYSLALRHFLLMKDEEKVSKLLNSLDSYVNLALENTDRLQNVNYLMLFITILENKIKMQPIVGDDFMLKTWSACKEKNWVQTETDKYAQLIKLIFGLASNEEFSTIATDLLRFTKASPTENYATYPTKLKIWESVLSCNLNPVKLKALQSVLERLLQKFTSLLQHSLPENLYENICNLEKSIVQTVHLPLTSPITDMILLNTTLLCNNNRINTTTVFNLSINLLESLLKYRKPIVMDRLPTFLQLYRMLLTSICERSNTDLNLEPDTIKEISDCSHQLEKLTKNLTSCQKDMARIAMYLIADILQQYEKITLHPNVKIHLNNCVYSLLSICDQHAIAFLMRSLSSASTEMFKDVYESYKKFYRFTGKV